jgi:hypothetical protein
MYTKEHLRRYYGLEPYVRLHCRLLSKHQHLVLGTNLAVTERGGYGCVRTHGALTKAASILSFRCCYWS